MTFITLFGNFFIMMFCFWTKKPQSLLVFIPLQASLEMLVAMVQTRFHFFAITLRKG